MTEAVSGTATTARRLLFTWCCRSADGHGLSSWSCRKRDCYSDEHYVPTLMAYLGLDNETTCSGNTMHVSWQSSSGQLTPQSRLLYMAVVTMVTCTAAESYEHVLGASW